MIYGYSFSRVVVAEPEKGKIDSLLGEDSKRMVHTLYVSRKSYRVVAETQQNAEQKVI